MEILIFLLQNTDYIFYNLYYDYWDLIIRFWPRSKKWNSPFMYEIFKTSYFYALALSWILACSSFNIKLKCRFSLIFLFNSYFCLKMNPFSKSTKKCQIKGKILNSYAMASLTWTIVTVKEGSCVAPSARVNVHSDTVLSAAFPLLHLCTK